MRDGLEAYRRSYGPDQYTIEASGWRLVVLNTCLLGDPHALPDEYAAQLDYLDSQLADQDGSRVPPGFRVVTLAERLSHRYEAV